MDNNQIYSLVRQLIAEAKDAKKLKAKAKVVKETNLPKSSGKLVDLKKELTALKQYKDELMAAKFAEKTSSTEVEFADLAKFAKELDALKAKGVALEKQVDDKIAELETRISDEKNKIKEMMGLAPEAGQEKMMDEKKMTSSQKKKKEDIVKGMKKSNSFGKSKDEKNKMYATATKLATKKMMNEYEYTYRKIDGICYKIDDEGNRTKVANHYCKY